MRSAIALLAGPFLLAVHAFTPTALIHHNPRPLCQQCVHCSAQSIDLKRTLMPSMLSGPELIDAGVRADTFAPQFLWLLIVAMPRSNLTKQVMGSIGPILGLSLVHLAVVLLAASAPGGTEPVKIFADVFDPAQNQLDGMVRLFEVRDFVAEEWPVRAEESHWHAPTPISTSNNLVLCCL
jgi:hypothetical protein